MAKANKKESTLTLEEKLAQALVPESEQPYKVPKNWCWVRLGKTVVLKRGASPRPIKAFVTELDGGINWIKIGDTNSGKYIDAVKEKITVEGKEKSVFVEKGTLLLSNSMSFGRPYILNVDGCIHDGWLAISTKETFDKEYLYYALLASNWYFEQVAVGTAVRNLNTDRVSNTPIVCPPLAEQRRIVERIESLFAKLDEAKEKLQEVLDGFETRKGAILHKAFTGELTAKWREEHGVSLDSWEKKKIKDVCIPRAGYAFDSKKFCESGYQVLRMGNLYAGELDLSRNPVFIDVADVNDDMLAKAKINDSDVLLTLTGTKYKRDYGYAVKVTEPVNLLLNQRILCLTPNNINGDYFLHYLRSKMFRDIFFSNETGGVNQGNVSSKFVENIEVTLPCGKEQNVIAQKLNVFIDKYNRSRQVVQDGINQVDFIKKAILARAFRGELGTNDENDECAVELLKRVL